MPTTHQMSDSRNLRRRRIRRRKWTRRRRRRRRRRKVCSKLTQRTERWTPSATALPRCRRRDPPYYVPEEEEEGLFKANAVNW